MSAAVSLDGFIAYDNDQLSGHQDLDETAEQAVGLLALIAGQDVEPAGDSDGTDGRWRIVRRTAPDRIISTVDTEARRVRPATSKEPAAA
uniref:hypothetical protein n=1 Tax=Nonomuraea bangladeshensis TaxID=404385 RepID=UPI003F496282